MDKRGIFVFLILGMLFAGMMPAAMAFDCSNPLSVKAGEFDAYWKQCGSSAAASSATAAPATLIAKAPAAPVTAATIFKTQCIDYRTVPPSIETPTDSQEIARLRGEGYECLEIQVEASATEESTLQLAGAELWWMTLNFPEISQETMARSVGINQPLNKLSVTKEIACKRSSASEVRCIGEINPFTIPSGTCPVSTKFELSFSEWNFLWLSGIRSSIGSCTGLETLEGIESCSSVSLKSCSGSGTPEVLEISVEKTASQQQGIQSGATVQRENVKIPIAGQGTARFTMAYGPRNLKIVRSATWKAFKEVNVGENYALNARQQRLFDYFGKTVEPVAPPKETMIASFLKKIQQ